MTDHQPPIIYQIDGFNFPPITVSYINSLLKPISDFFNTPNLTLNDLYSWIHGLDMYIGPVFRRVVDASPQNLQLSKSNIINYLSTEISQLTVNIVRDERLGDYVLPWDIRKVVEFDQELTVLLNIPPPIIGVITPVLLPVIIQINGEDYSHMLTCEFTFGLLVFLSVSPCCYTISMFGQILTPEYSTINRFRYYNIPNERPYYGRRYSILIMGIEYRFKTTDFIQGFTTGAEWCGLHHRNYWSNLSSISYSTNDEKILTPMTF